MYDLFPNIETIHTAYGNLIPNLDHTQHAINGPPTWDLYPQWHSLRCLSDGVMFQDWSIWCFLVCCNFIFSPKFSLFPFYFCVLPFCVLPTSLLHLSFSKDEDFYLQHTLLVLSSVFVRRDSSVIKEEIKAFLANRRISQAVVAQVTGKSRRALYSRIMSVSAVCAGVGLSLTFPCCSPVGLGMVTEAWDLNQCLWEHGHAPVSFLFKTCVSKFCNVNNKKKIPYFIIETGISFPLDYDSACDTCTPAAVCVFIFKSFAVLSIKSRTLPVKSDSWGKRKSLFSFFVLGVCCWDFGFVVVCCFLSFLETCMQLRLASNSLCG